MPSKIRSRRRSSRSKKRSRRSVRRSRRGIRKSIRKSKSINKSGAIILEKSKLPGKKYRAIIGNKTINFGAKTYSDYTLHKDKERMHRYVSRHKSRENWTKSGIKSAGFWSKWILWNKPSLRSSIKNTEEKFGIRIINRI
jgi:hypothetical protein